MRADPLSGCLDEETIAALIGGRLAAAAIARAEAHVSSCASCQSVVADAAHGAHGGTGAPYTPSASAAVTATSSTTTAATTGDADVDADAASVPLRAGEVIVGKYRIDRVLGRGGMGVVFAATHLELGQRVAVKVLHQRGEAVTRFVLEARTSARLTSEHVPRIFDFGSLPDGAPYLVMEHLVGSDLARIVAAAGALPVADAVRYVVEAGAALVEAHAAGIVHRDLKPANLFVAERAAGGRVVKVLDFGISKIIPEIGSDEAFGLTTAGAALGSPRYMSPEQMRASKDVDARTDIWSLGVILYQLLAGEAPFHAPTLSALAVAVATETPPPLSSFRADLPPGLEAVVLRCLAKQREDRFPSVKALLESLAPFVVKRPARPKALRIAVAAGAALAVAGGLWAVVGPDRAPSSKEQPSARTIAEPDGAATPGAPIDRVESVSAAVAPFAPDTNSDSTRRPSPAPGAAVAPPLRGRPKQRQRPRAVAPSPAPPAPVRSDGPEPRHRTGPLETPD